MAWSATVDGSGVVGADRIVYGTFTDAQTSGTQTIDTGFGYVKACGAVVSNAGRAIGVSISGGTINLIAATNDDDGIWWAIGK